MPNKLSFLNKYTSKKYIGFFIFTIIQSIVLSQAIIDSSRIDKYMTSVVTPEYGLSRKDDNSRFNINDKNHSLEIEEANRNRRFTYFFDSICKNHTRPLNCRKVDSLISKFPNQESLNWGKSIKIYDFQSKKHKIEQLKLLQNCFGNIDSIVSCKKLFINSDSEPDIAILKKVVDWDFKIDSATSKISYFKGNKLKYQLDLLINHGNTYTKIHSSDTFDIEDLEYIYFANFKIKNRAAYFIKKNSKNEFANFLKMVTFIIE